MIGHGRIRPPELAQETLAGVLEYLEDVLAIDEDAARDGDEEETTPAPPRPTTLRETLRSRR